MALQIITTDMIGPGTQVQLGATDDAFIVAGVTVGSTASYGIVSSGSDQTVNVQGTVLGQVAGIDLGLPAESGQVLTIGANAYVAGFGTATGAVTMRGVDNEVHNAGTIHGEGYGIRMIGNGAGNHSTIDNSGLIEGSIGIWRDADVANTQQMILHNSGKIVGINNGFLGHVSYYGGTQVAVDTIQNSGLMSGNILLGAGDDSYDGTGGSVVGIVFGDAGNDTLTGGNSADTLWGGAGGDFLSGAGGDDHLNGEADNDVISGGAGNDTIDGGTGADVMSGGAGNDLYTVDNAGDFVQDDGGGFDIVQSSVDFNFSDAHQSFGSLERLILTGTDNLNGTGNALANSLFGNIGNNTLAGNAGNDTLYGYDGNDRLSGGVGKDSMTGGLGKDQFVFDSKLSAKTNVDAITDFQHGVDKILLDNAIFKTLGLVPGALKAGFFYAGKAAHDANDHIIYNKATGALSYDVDGVGGHAAVQFATLAGHPTINYHDFQVI